MRRSCLTINASVHAGDIPENRSKGRILTVAESSCCGLEEGHDRQQSQQRPPGLFPRLEHRGQPLAPHWLFYRRLSINFALGLTFILVSLAAGMLGYRYLEGLSWLRSFGHAAMILGGMGPYGEPVGDGSKLFEGIYAIYCGLLLIGVTGLILAPVFHRVMHQLHLPDDDDAAQRSSSEAVAQEKTDKPKPKPRAKAEP